MEKKYFYGNEISNYGLENGYVDYRTLAKAFDAVLANNIIQDTESIGYWEQEHGFVDNSEEIEELENNIDELTETLETLETEETRADIEKLIEEYENEIDFLRDEEDNPCEIYQYYIISSWGAELLERETNEIVFYNDALDLYVWGVCHWGTSWDYVLTNIKIDW